MFTKEHTNLTKEEMDSLKKICISKKKLHEVMNRYADDTLGWIIRHIDSLDKEYLKRFL